ncbi:Retrovirus-related Gag polyprotein [Cricetulus griseus]|uniref:Retrovirus-related Gag polyprotein n=1 Tax=Cricetulus griseus TaxID=10029 RepID=G3HJK5_CRIGR|nr:Retrovirus-related Gag polyprotein [Cricetulus griseus]
MEPFADFVARMVEAAGRVFGNSDAAMPLIKQLVYEQCSVCVFPQDQQDPVWVPERLIRKIQHEEHHECQHGDASAPSHDESTGDGGAEMGDTVSIPKTYASDAGVFPRLFTTNRSLKDYLSFILEIVI